MPAGLLADVLDWCAGHPHDGPLPEYGPVTMRRYADGSVAIEGDAPGVLGVSAELLDAALAEVLSFADGVLTVNVLPGPFYYRPLGPDPRVHVVVFERIEEA